MESLGQRDHNNRTGLVAFCRTMWIGPAVAAAAVIDLALSTPTALGAAGPMLALWFVSPVFAWWVSRPLARRAARLTAGQTIFLQKLSRKTWGYFETFVGPEDHWLPPDNFQEHPAAVIAHRTSPTNMGLALLANLSAYDFGYIPAEQLIERTANAFHTMEALERHRGHFYNWYDTQSLKPLLPKYISTVDSGNLAAPLLILRQGLLALPDHKILGARFFDGLSDTLRILTDVAGEAAPVKLAQLQEDLASDSRPATLSETWQCLNRLTASAAAVLDTLDGDNPESQAKWWARALVQQCRRALDDLAFLAPWILLPASSESLKTIGGIEGIPTLRELAKLGAELSPAIDANQGSDAYPGSPRVSGRHPRAYL